MHLGIPALLAFCGRHGDAESLVLATIIGTCGSTYRKTGAMMLISRDGDFEGLISGGCLEGDLLEHAAGVFETGEPEFVTYDMSADEDLIWNLGIGCDGVIHLLLQRLDKAGSLDLFRRIESSHEARKSVLLAMVTRGNSALAPGQLASLEQEGEIRGETLLAPVLEQAADNWPDWRSDSSQIDAADVLLIHMPPRPRVLICGAGPDAVPVAQAFCSLDWEVVVVDHRAAFARKDRFPPDCRVLRLSQAELHKKVDLGEIDAAVIMSHHLQSDAEYLRQLCGHPLKYLGVLGPKARKDHLRALSACAQRDIYGPVGLDIGAELPAGIALSIAAEVHAVMNGRDGRPLAGGSYD